MRKAYPEFAPRLGIVERWRATCGSFLLAGPWLVLAFGILLPFYHHVGWLVGVLGLAGIALGCMLGGYDRTSGAEEYIMALPPSRQEQYWVRALLGLVIPISAVIGILIIKYDISATVWALVCSSGWTQPVGYASGTIWTAAAVIIPTALFAVSYGGATIGGVQVGLLGSLLLGLIAGGGAMLEHARWGVGPNGWLTLPAFAIVGVLALPACYPLYLRRDMVSRGRRNHAGLVAVVLCILFILLMFFLSAGSMQVNRTRAVMEAERKHEQAMVEKARAKTVEMTAKAKDGGGQ